MRERLEPGFIVSSWALCLLATVALSALVSGVLALVLDRPLTGETNTDLGLLTIVTAGSTFIMFSAVMAYRLTRVAHDRLTNSLAVAGLHVLVAAALFALELALRGAGAASPAELFDGSWTDQVGNAFAVVERSAVAAIAACLVVVGTVPAVGDRPAATQTEATHTDLQL